MDNDSTDGWDDSAEDFDDSSDVWDDSLWNDDMQKRRKYLHGDPPKIDWETLKFKLSLNAADLKLDPVPQWFHVIDVERRKVVRAPSEPFDYVCLSYTWGDAQEFQATRDSIIKLQEDGALDRPEHPEKSEGPGNPQVPTTIRDAMTACQHLGKKYLWVDRLCILQDGAEKQIHFDEMGRIYNGAFVTLVAFEGTDARYGLHGISRPIDLSASEVDFWTRSEWLKRGWTYQEAILSRGLIIFAKDGIILEHEREAALMTKIKESEDFLHRPVFHGAIDYYFAVETYTKRKLGLQGDIVNAFSGICNHLFDKVHYFGIPTNDFNNAMHWLINKAEREERVLDTGHTFPSWSWASIKGQTLFPRILPALPIASWAFVNSIDDHGNLSLSYPTPRDHALSYKLHAYSPMIVSALYAREYDPKPGGQEYEVHFEYYKNLNASPRPWSMDDPFKTTLKVCLDEFSEYTWFWEFCRDIGPHSQNEHDFLNQRNSPQDTLCYAPGRILAHSLVSNVRIRCPEVQMNIKIYPMNHICIGYGYLDDPKFLTKPRRRDGPETRDSLEFKIFALSISMMTKGEVSRIFSSRGMDYPLNYPSHVLLGSRENDQDLVVNVVIIEESEEMYVFNRVGFGFINFKAWVEQTGYGKSSDRQWRTIALI
ncbi:heterokaryon incompatibility protein-domain-containing protein [Phyllosticta capitalensis]